MCLDVSVILPLALFDVCPPPLSVHHFFLASTKYTASARPNLNAHIFVLKMNLMKKKTECKQNGRRLMNFAKVGNVNAKNIFARKKTNVCWTHYWTARVDGYFLLHLARSTHHVRRLCYAIRNIGTSSRNGPHRPLKRPTPDDDDVIWLVPSSLS